METKKPDIKSILLWIFSIIGVAIIGMLAITSGGNQLVYPGAGPAVNVALIVGDSTSLTTWDLNITSYLEADNMTVTLVDDGNTTFNASNFDAVFISNSAGGQQDAVNNNNDSTTGFVVNKGLFTETMGLCTDEISSTTTNGNVVDNAEYTTSFLSTGTYAMYTASEAYNYCNNAIGAGATVLVERDGASTRKLVYQYEQGATDALSNSAAGRRIAIYHADTNPAIYTSDSWDIAVRATRWAANAVIPEAPANITISGISVSAGNDSALITWSTNLAANSSVNYGTTTALGTQLGNATLVTSHSINVTGLTNNTLYYYNITSANSTYSITNGTFNFTTLQNGAGPVVGGCGIGYLNESCVVDRSSCESITNDLGFVCFRNDTNTSYTNPFNPKDLAVENEQSELFLSYQGSPMKLYGDSIKNYKTGIGRLTFRNWNAIVERMITVNADWDKIRWTGWGMIFSGNSANLQAEGYIVPINEYAWVMNLRVQCKDADGCNDVTDYVYFEHRSDQVKDYKTNIDTSYSGFIINVSEASNVFSTDALNESFLVAFNESPDSYDLAFSGTQARVYYNMSYLETKDLTIVVTTEWFENNISDWIENPVYYIDRAINFTAEDIRKMNYPTGLNTTEKQAYFVNYYNLNYNVYKSNPREQNISNFGTNRVLAPTWTQYKGTWIWDSFFTCMGIFSVFPTDSSLTQVCKENLDVWVEWTQAYDNDVRINREIHELNTRTNTWQPNGGWTTVIIEMYKRGVINQSYLCGDVWDVYYSNYQSIIGNYTKFGNQITTPSASTLGWDGSDTWTSGGTQIDATAWTLIDARNLNIIAGVCGNSTVQSALQSDINTYSQGLEDMWDETWQQYTDRNSAGDTYYFDGNLSSPAISPKSYWVLVANATTNQTRINAVLNMQNNELNEAYLLPTLYINHTSYDPTGATDNWDGRVWSPPNIMALQAMIGQGETGNKTILVDNIIDRISKNFAGIESYEATTGDKPSGSFNFVPYTWSGAEYFMAINQKLIFNFTDISGNDTTAPAVTITYPVDATIYNTNVTYIDGTQSDLNGLSECWYNYNGTNVTFTCNTQVTGLNIGDGVYTLYMYANDTSNNIGSDSISFTVNTSVNNVTDWEARFNQIDIDRNNRKCVLNFNLGDALYGEQNECMEAYRNMYYFSSNESYLEYLDDAMLNMTIRWVNGENIDLDDFRSNHMAGILAETIWLLNNTANASLKTNVPLYFSLLQNLSGTEDYFRNWTINGTPMGRYTNDTSAASSYRVRPNNQDYKALAKHIYLYNITGNASHYTMATQLANALVYTIRTEACTYNTSKNCSIVPYRFNYTQAGEDYVLEPEYGFPPHEERNNYLRQQLEAFIVGYRHGFIAESVMDGLANSFTENAYIQEGGTTNVLISRDIGYPPLTTLTDFHTLGRTSDTASWNYFTAFTPTINSIMLNVVSTTYDCVHDGDGTYTWYQKCYQTITDPRNSQVSTYADDDNAYTLPNTMLKQIATYLLNGTGPVSVFSAPIPDDSCTYTSGNWIINLSDACVITSNVAVSGNITFIGSGNITIQANITGWTRPIHIKPGVHCQGGCFI